MFTIKVREVCEILNGFAFKSDNYVNSGIRIIRIANVQKGYIEDNAPVFYPVNSTGIDKYMLEEGDLLMSLTGNVGRVAILEKKFLPAALNQRVACLRLKNNNILKKYLFYIFNSNYFEQQCIQSSQGIAQKNLSSEWVKDYEIPVYNLNEQKRIITVLDKVGQIILNRKQQIQQIDKLVKARFVEMFGDPITNEMGWEKVQLSTCIESIDNGKSLVCDASARQGNWPAVLKLSAATYGFYRPEENKAMLNENQFVEDAAVRAGDLLFTRKNTPKLVGMCAYVYDTPSRLMMPDLIFRLNTTNRCNKMFLWKLINHDLFRDCIQAIATGSAKSMSNISKERLLSLEIILPPAELQEQFAAFVAQTDKSKFRMEKNTKNLCPELYCTIMICFLFAFRVIMLPEGQRTPEQML